MPYRTSLALGLLALLMALLVALASPAQARSGVYRGPGGMVPPGLREPSDPAPPPPPPPMPVPHRPGASPATPTRPVPTTPPPPFRSAPPRAGTRPHAMSFADWPFWYHHHKELLEWPLGEVSPFRASAPDTAELHAKALAALLDAAKPKEGRHPAVTSAGLIALGKVADSEDHVDLLLEALANRHPRNLLMRESAALGLGLLRRHAGQRVLGDHVYAFVRDYLLMMVETDREPARLRGFAAAAVGLLGDQPDADPSATTARLFRGLRIPANNADLPFGILLGLMRQDEASFGAEELDGLRAIAYGGRLGRATFGDAVRCQALTVLGRVGAVEDVGRMELVLRERRGGSANLRRSAACSLALLGSRFSPAQRTGITATLLRALRTEPDDTARRFTLVSLPLLMAGSDHGTRRVLESTLAGEVLLAAAAYGEARERPWAALAIAEMLRRTSHTGPVELGAFEPKARAALQSGLDAEDSRTRAGFALALGIAQDFESRDALRALTADRAADGMLRGYAMLGLAFLGPRGMDFDLLVDHLPERRNEAHHRLLAEAAGVVRAIHAVPALGRMLHDAKSMEMKGQAAWSLGSIATKEAAEALLALAGSEDPRRRAIAIAGLGRLLDPNFFPSLVLLTWRPNYRASTSLLNELYSIL